MLSDGHYDAFIVDASTRDDALHLEMTIISGEHKGEVIGVVAYGLGADAVDVLGLPACLIVENGTPRVELER